jgi:hypothetical protein
MGDDDASEPKGRTRSNIANSIRSCWNAFLIDENVFLRPVMDLRKLGIILKYEANIAVTRAGIFKQSMGSRNRVGIGF